MFSPTRSTLGTELFQMVHQGAANFRAGRAVVRELVAGPRLESAADGATVNHTEAVGRKTLVESARGVGLDWRGAAIVNGRM